MCRQHFALAGCLIAGCLLALQAPAAAAELWIGPNGTGIPVVVKPPPAPPAPVERPEMILPRPVFMHVSMDVLVDGKPLRTVTHRGKTYLPVPAMGAEYEVRINNHGPRRISAVVSVDGLSVITGQPASEESTGYLVAPYGHIVIKGWRRDMAKVAAFRFVDRDESYAKLMGYPENVGVIGLVAFEELVPRPLPREEAERRAPAADGKSLAGTGGVGTGYGRDVDSPVYYVPFVRSGNKRAITFYYDTEEALRRAGILPVPFPADEFAPPPPGYKGR